VKVPETYEAVRTVNKTEYIKEAYTAYRTEMVPETKTINKTITKKVPEYRDEVRKVCKMVSVMETQTVMKKVVKCEQVHTTYKKCVDQGHWQFIEVPAGGGLFSGLRKSCGHGCKDECAPACPATVTKKVWCPNKVWIDCPTVKTVRRTECVPETVQVCVKKPVYSEETVRVCTYKCVTEVVPTTCTVMVKKCTPYEAFRTVAKCVPVQEKYMATRYVEKTITKQVPVAPEAPCVAPVTTEACGGCAAPMVCDPCSSSRRLFRRCCK
jgi:hypothetical protein